MSRRSKLVLTPESLEVLRSARANGATYVQLAEACGVSARRIWQVLEPEAFLLSQIRAARRRLKRLRAAKEGTPG